LPCKRAIDAGRLALEATSRPDCALKMLFRTVTPRIAEDNRSAGVVVPDVSPMTTVFW